MQQKQFFYISISEDGTFENITDKILYVEMTSVVRISLNLKSPDYKPLILTRKPLDRKTKKLSTVEKNLKASIYSFEKLVLPMEYESVNLENIFDVAEMQLDDQGDYILEIEMVKPGSQFFRLVYVKNGQIIRVGVPNYFVVQPQIKLQCYNIQTVLPYSMGPFNEWTKHFLNQIKVGYKAFHFPPIQKLGASGSYYSIFEQQTLNPDLFQTAGIKELGNLIKELNTQYGTLFFVDILLNHTAYDSEWLNRYDMMNATYHIGNTPHLACAIELDIAIANFSNALGNKEIKSYSRGNEISTDQDVIDVMNILENEIIRPLQLQEYFLMDIPRVINEIQINLNQQLKISEDEIEQGQQNEEEQIFMKSPKEVMSILLPKSIIQKGYARFGVTLKMDQIIQFLNKNENWKKISTDFLKQQLEQINQDCLNQAYSYIQQAIDTTKGQLRQLKVVEKVNCFITPSPLGNKFIPRYFTKLKDGRHVANTGWISGCDPLINFAENELEHFYFRRNIFIWEDIVKLRYGMFKKDSPALWKFMKKYVKMMASVFHGLRLDNANSTPRHVGEYMMRKARRVNQNVLAFAELFTGSNEKDALYTKQFGLNALVREIQGFSDGSSMNGGISFFSDDGISSIGSLPIHKIEINGQVYKNLRAISSPSLLYEQSHDNESLISTYGFKHQLPVSAVIAFAKCLKGTVRGYDDYFEKRLVVNNERRKYHLSKFDQFIQSENTIVPIVFRLDLSESGKKVEVKGSFDNWQTGHVLQLEPHFKTTEGHHIYTTTIDIPIGCYEYHYLIDEVQEEGQDKEKNSKGNRTILVEKEIIKQFNNLCEVRNKLCGLSQIIEEKYPSIYVNNHYNSSISIVRASQKNQKFKVLIAQPEFKEHYPFPIIELPGELETVDHIWYNEDWIQFHTNEPTLVPSEVKINGHNILRAFAEIHYNAQKRSHILKFVKFPKSLEKNYSKNLEKIQEEQQNIYDECFKPLSTNDINFLLFSSEAEERERTNHQLYNLPYIGNLVYGGFYGTLKKITSACKRNDLGNHMMENLRQGDWLIEYLSDRLNYLQSESSRPLRNYLNNKFIILKQIPRYLIPRFFTQLIQQICDLSRKRITETANPIVIKSPFCRELSLAGYQFLAQIKSATSEPYKYSLSAGHPQFSIGWSRVRGRDCFISFKGILLANNLIDEAREIILQFATCLRHGLIPNLLDCGNRPRYNSRDACWWFIKALKEFFEQSKEYSLLKTQINMRYLHNDQKIHELLLHEGQRKILTLSDIIQDIFQQHAIGIKFREWNAGKEIDRYMTNEGFDIQLKLDRNSGFIVGGNQKNCLTWMNLMGSSGKAQNKGHPATPRDGAPIELTALLKLSLDFIIDLNQKGYFPYDSVNIGNKKLLYKDWSELILKNFEKYYWVPQDKHDFNQYQVNPAKVKRLGIYRDTCLSSKQSKEYQLRCNACIAIAIAPELFTKENAILHLENTEKNLVYPESLGIKSLDCQEKKYIGFFDKEDKSCDFQTAHGFSLHNGPEWLWVYGYYLKAMFIMHKIDKNHFYSYLSNHKKFLFKNQWYSLPELTNHNGKFNIYSNRAQASSIGCILEVILDYENSNQKEQ